MGEDAARFRAGHAPANHAALNNIVLAVVFHCGFRHLPEAHRHYMMRRDDALDALKGQVFRELLSFILENPAKTEPALDLILISRHLERIGDHATNIAEEAIFIVSGRDVRHHGREGGARGAEAPPHREQ